MEQFKSTDGDMHDVIGYTTKGKKPVIMQYDIMDCPGKMVSGFHSIYRINGYLRNGGKTKHNGVDTVNIKVPGEDIPIPIYSPANAVVEIIDNSFYTDAKIKPLYGNWVVLKVDIPGVKRHNFIGFKHLRGTPELNLKVGDKVKAGETIIGYEGSSGRVGRHLHIEVQNGNTLDTLIKILGKNNKNEPLKVKIYTTQRHYLNPMDYMIDSNRKTKNVIEAAGFTDETDVQKLYGSKLKMGKMLGSTYKCAPRTF